MINAAIYIKYLIITLIQTFLLNTKKGLRKNKEHFVVCKVLEGAIIKVEK